MEEFLTNAIGNLNDVVTLLSCASCSPSSSSSLRHHHCHHALSSSTSSNTDTPRGSSDGYPDSDSISTGGGCKGGGDIDIDSSGGDYLDKITGKVLSALELLLKLSRAVNYANGRDARAKRLIEKMKILTQTQALAIEKLSKKPEISTLTSLY